MIDLNLDAGEDIDKLRDGSEERLYRMVTRVNIACGGHAGNEQSMSLALKLAKKAKVKVGAHPGYPDKKNFGRLPLSMSQSEVSDFVEAQVQKLKALCDAEGLVMEHVKAHGALYNQLAKDISLATAFAEGVERASPHSTLIGLAGSPALTHWQSLGFKTMGEGFSDRAYQKDGTLTPRDLKGAVIHDPKAAKEQVLNILQKGKVQAITGEWIAISCQTVCIHGDNPEVEAILKEVKKAVRSAG